MNKKITIKKFSSFDEAEASDKEEYLRMTPAERIELMQHLREMSYKFSFTGKKNEDRKRLRRVIKVI